MTRSKRPLLLGFAVAPAAASVVTTPFLALAWPSLFESAWDMFAMMPVVALVALFHAYAGSVVIGLPLVSLLMMIDRLSTRTLCLLSLPSGAAFWVSCRIIYNNKYSLSEVPQDTLLGSGVALSIAATFCAVVGLNSDD